MRLEYLKIFTDLARSRSFSQTAHMNGVSQSAVSQAVGQLEKRLGVILVDRSTRPLNLTPPGKAFWEGCSKLLEDYRELEASLGRAAASIATSVRVTAIYSVGMRDMSLYIERFSATHEGAEVRLEYQHPEQVLSKVLSGEADLGLISYARSTRELTAVPWREEPMLLACAPHHPLARLSSLRITQLDGQKYIGFTRDLAIRRKIDQFLRQRGVSVDVILEFDNIEYVKKALEVGSGVALLPEPMLEREVGDGALAAIPLSDCRLVRPLYILHRRNHRLSPAAADFVELLRQPEAAPARHSRRRGQKPGGGSTGDRASDPAKPGAHPVPAAAGRDIP